ncbi:MAG: hypothetical protein K2X35_21030 [Bryobacteraceae bacterium]|nr:hypothetical protein [Bryobacteraceae bacterium]
MIRTGMAALMLVVAASAQEAPPAPSLTPAEKEFQESMNNVQLVGFFTTGDSEKLSGDKYTIERVTKVKDDTWKFEARIQYNGKDFKMGLPVPVKWAGNTPVIAVDNYTIPGYGTFNARVVIHQSDYAGTWSGTANGKTWGGKMFGKIVKLDAAPAK